MRMTMTAETMGWHVAIVFVCPFLSIASKQAYIASQMKPKGLIGSVFSFIIESDGNHIPFASLEISCPPPDTFINSRFASFSAL